MVGRTLSHYKIVAPLGSGGMGVVYRAEDVRLGRAVALKFVHEELAHDPMAVERLRSEARAASALNHPNICTIYDIGDEDGHPFIAMELMTGHSLRDLLTGGRLKVHQVVTIGIECADALDAAHSGGIIHRDVKPANIFVTDRGHAKVLDFGLAKPALRFAAAATTGSDLTASGVTLGTPSYMSPEQATGEPLDGRTDLFSLGVVLYEVATGAHPFPGKTSAAILAAILTRAPVAPVALNPELPQRLQDIINNCLEKDRELRYQSAADLRADLKRLRRDIESGHSRAIPSVAAAGPGSSSAGASEATPPSAGEPSPKAARGWPRSWLVGTALALVLLWSAYALISLTKSAPPVPPVGAPAAAPAAAPLQQNRLDLARASLDAGNHRAALAYATEVLSLHPEQPEALRIRDTAQAMIARFDAELARARELIEAGNYPRATRALEQARAIDPTNPVVGEAAAALAERLHRREQDLAARSRGEGPARGAARADAPSVPSPAPATVSTAGTATKAEPAGGAAPSPVVPPTVTVPPPMATMPSAGTTVVPPPPPPPPTPRTPATSPSARPADAAAPAAVDEDAAIRKVTATYARAIESKDIGLFRSVKPNLSGEEERRLNDAFRAVSSQEVALTIQSVERKGNEATVRLRRRDTIHAGGRDHTAERQQTLTLVRGENGWVITDIR